MVIDADISLSLAGPAPLNLAAISELNDMVLLSWQPPSEASPDAYNLYRTGQSGGPYQSIAEEISETSYVDQDVQNGYIYYYAVTAVYDNPVGESFYSNEVVAMPGGTFPLPFSADFEDDDSGFYLQVIEEGSDGSPWEHGAPDPGHGPGEAASGQNLWATGLAENYPNSADLYLLSPVVNLTYAQQAELSFDHWYEFEGTPERGEDGGNVAVSIDAGENWTFIQPTVPYSDPDIPGLDNEPGFTGPSNGWLQSTFDLTDFIGNTITVRFRFGSDSGINRAGWFIDNVLISGTVEAIEDNDRVDAPGYFLEQNYPNPFNPATTISFQIATKERVTINVYSPSGRLVKELVDESLPAGLHTAVWKGRNDMGLPVGSGVYFYRLKAGARQVEQKRMVLLK
ncbi:MAG: T9SS type A sorting domain-containing protein [Planctomycetes bacterium]|nr:T9SS type A sorting domain-containing protein [Planctomycetota bacterium]